jgi:hypothetical protein
VQAFTWSPKYPHGHGFIAATRWKFAGEEPAGGYAVLVGDGQWRERAQFVFRGVDDGRRISCKKLQLPEFYDNVPVGESSEICALSRLFSFFGFLFPKNNPFLASFLRNNSAFLPPDMADGRRKARFSPPLCTIFALSGIVPRCFGIPVARKAFLLEALLWG